MASVLSVLEEAQRRHEARLAWLRSLKTGDAVLLTCDGADRLKTSERVTVCRCTAGVALYVAGHPRRDVRTGRWERHGKAWLSLRIDPVEDR